MKKETCALLSVGEVRPDPHWHLPSHLHSTHHELILILDGTLLLKTTGQEIVATSGDVLFYERGMIHEEMSQPHDPVNTYFLAFQTGRLLPSFPLHLRDSNGRLRELFSWLVRDQRQGRPIQECGSLLEAILGELHWLGTSPRDPWLEKILDYMRRHFAEDLALNDLACQVDMSRFAFIRKFKRLTGHTPMDELRRIRLNEARNLILSSGLPLKSIAPAVGLGDEYQLSKLFRRYHGISPSELRTRSRPARARSV